MGELDGAGARHELVVQHLEVRAHLGRRVVRQEGGHHEGAVNLVEGQPVTDLVLVLAHNTTGKAIEQVDGLAVLPTAKLLLDVQRRVVVTQRHQGLDALLAQLGKDGVVEVQALLVRLGLHARGEDAAPGDGHAEQLDAHLAQKRDVLGVAVVEVDGIVIGVVLALDHVELGALGQRGKHRAAAGGAVGQAIGHGAQRLDAAARRAIALGHAAAALIPTALVLVSGGRATPQKVLREHRHGYFLSIDGPMRAHFGCARCGRDGPMKGRNASNAKGRPRAIGVPR